MKREKHTGFIAFSIICLFYFALSLLIAAEPPKPNPALEYATGIGEIGLENYDIAEQHFTIVANNTTDPVLLKRARFLAGWSAFQQSKWPQAADWFSKYISPGDILNEYAAYYRSISLSRSGQYDKALASFQTYFASYPKTVRYFEARMAQADLLILKGRYSDAFALLQNLLKEVRNEDQRARVLLRTGNCYESLGKPEDAKKIYRDIYIYRPASGSSAKSGERLKALGANLDSIAFADRYLRAETLYKRAKFEDAFTDYKKLIADPTFVKDSVQGRQILVRHAMCLYRLYYTEDAATAFYKIATELPPGAYTGTGYYYYAHCMGRMEKRDESMAGYRSVINKAPTSNLVPDAWINVAQIYGEMGKWDDVLRCFETVRKNFPARAAQLNVSWRIGWMKYRRGEYDQAIANFNAREDTTELARMRNTYWIGRALEKIGKKDEAAAQYKSIVAAKPFGYYAAWALARLGKEPLSSVSVQNPEVHTVPSLSVKDSRIDRARELAQMGLTDLAVDEVSDFERRTDLQFNDRMAICLLYRSYGDYNLARHAMMGYASVEGKKYNENDDRYWRIFYPRPYTAQVLALSSERSVSPNMVWSLMMQESGFKPKIVSPAGAIGLMQIIPPTAKQIARKLKLVDFKEHDLFDPTTNVHMGITYLADMADSMGDHPARFYLAAAAYNGGPVNVGRWARARSDLEMDEFVEEIPIKETQNYVKKVFANWTIYQMLYGKSGAAGVPLPVGVKMKDVASKIMN